MRVFRPAELGVGIRLRSTASYLPERVVTNEALVVANVFTKNYYS
jgi:hypothetical protein